MGLPTALGYYLACGVAALAIGRSGGAARRGRSGESAAVGVVQVAGLALGFLFLSLYSGVLEQLETLLFGTFLGIDSNQVLTLALVAVVVLAALSCDRASVAALVVGSRSGASARPARGPIRRRLSVDPWPHGSWTSQINGALLVFALLVAPPAAAQALRHGAP